MSHNLTVTQTNVLGLIAKGATNAQIADALGVSEKTVKVHVSAIMGRLGARNRTTAALIALGLPTLPENVRE
jgi:DNA-binding NarL/FixJ family response regulator